MSVQCNPQSVTFAATRGWVLSGRPEGQESREFPLKSLPFRVGRKSGLSLTLPRNTVSGNHAEFFEQGGALWVRDLGSTNGTFVNGDRLTEPRELHENDLVQFADIPFRLTMSQSEHPSHTRSKDACDQALALVQMDRLLGGSAVVPHYQPIVDLKTNAVVAYEVLARSRLVGLETPEFMFTAAAELGLTTALSEELRRVAINSSSPFSEVPHLFLNTHPCELQTQTLLESCQVLRKSAPHQRITIEIHEAAITEVAEMSALERGLAAIDMTLAFDDFGAGQARLVELAEIRPQYIKFDRKMVQNLHTADATRQRVVRGLVGTVRDVGIIPLAEGVEIAEERDACIDAGFVLSQGFLHGRPMPATHYLTLPWAGTGDQRP